MTLSGKVPSDEDLLSFSLKSSNQAALLSEIATQLIGDEWKHSFSGFTSDVSVDIGYRTEVPKDEVHRNQYLIQKAEDIISDLISFSSRIKTGSVILKKEVLELMVCLIRYKPTHRHAFLKLQSEHHSRTKLQRLAFGFLREILLLSPASFSIMAHEVVFCGIRILQNRCQPEAQEVADEYSSLSREIYAFLGVALDSSAISFTSSEIRDLVDCIATDIRYPRLEDAALSCLIMVVQLHVGEMKTESKDRIFSIIVAGLKYHLRLITDRKHSGYDSRIVSKIFTLITAFLLGTTVHLGILNICSGLFHDGLAVRDMSLSIICRQGLQVCDSILRPRAPKEIFERNAENSQPLAAIYPVCGDSYFIQPTIEKPEVLTSATTVVIEKIQDSPLKRSSPESLNIEGMLSKRQKPSEERESVPTPEVDVTAKTNIETPAELSVSPTSVPISALADQQVSEEPESTQVDEAPVDQTGKPDVVLPNIPGITADEADIERQVSDMLSFFNDSGPDEVS